MARKELITRIGKPDRNDVALLAGVSTATVSRVFNAPELVSKDKVDRVLAAAQKLSYVPDKNASALRRSGSGTIMLLEQKGAAGFGGGVYDWFYAGIIKSIKSVVDNSMYQLQLASFTGEAEIRALGNGPAADGIIYRADLDKRLLFALEDTGIPYVVTGQTDTRMLHHNRAYIDEHFGAGLAAGEFMKRGFTKPAHITGNLTGQIICQSRWAGFQEPWGKNKPLLFDGTLGIQGGYASSKSILERIRRKHIDCIFVVNDLTAIGVVQALLAGGINIPGDVALIGYDNLPFIDTFPFTLATIDIGFDRLYSEATTELLRSIRNRDPINIASRPRFVDGISAG